MAPVHRVLAFCAFAPATQPAWSGDILALGAPPQPGPWLGPETHIVLSGSINGRPVRLGMPATFAGSYGWGVTATRRYEYKSGQYGQPWVGAVWRYQGIKVEMEAVAQGLATVTVWLSAPDWAWRPAPATWTLATLPGTLEDDQARLRVRVQWQTDDTLSVEEASDWVGTLTLAQDEGERDGTASVLWSGQVGGVVEATQGEDSLWISFSAPVDEVQGPRR